VFGYLGMILLHSSFGNSGRSMYLIVYLKLGLRVLNVIWFKCYVLYIKRHLCVDLLGPE
jgi:hypothetical protein